MSSENTGVSMTAFRANKIHAGSLVDFNELTMFRGAFRAETLSASVGGENSVAGPVEFVFFHKAVKSFFA